MKYLNAKNVAEFRQKEHQLKSLNDQLGVISEQGMPGFPGLGASAEAMRAWEREREHREGDVKELVTKIEELKAEIYRLLVDELERPL